MTIRRPRREGNYTPVFCWGCGVYVGERVTGGYMAKEGMKVVYGGPGTSRGKPTLLCDKAECEAKWRLQ